MAQPETVQTSKHCLAEIEAWLVAHVAEAAGIAAEEVDVQETFDSFGLSSRALLDQYTRDFEMDAQGMPGLKLGTKEGSTARWDPM